eukprot:TRINITY_DN12627_c0_g1_i1.p2 TRINITY_DN12627_c0_g1~~TRINITY_DN12627_c0_g1_i1.p2  ORF type:complete len:116 (-),score=9.18 TRINITY_DN12627_c0_g1_i1:13-360(-)
MSSRVSMVWVERGRQVISGVLSLFASYLTCSDICSSCVVEQETYSWLEKEEVMKVMCLSFLPNSKYYRKFCCKSWKETLDALKDTRETAFAEFIRLPKYCVEFSELLRSQKYFLF